MHTAPYFTAFGLLAILNSIRVVTLRRRFKVSLGEGQEALLQNAVRAFGNLTEYAPLGLILLLALEFIQSPVWFMHLCGGLLLIGRVVHLAAFSREKISMQGRVVGMTLTWLALLLSSVGLLVISMVELHG